MTSVLLMFARIDSTNGSVNFSTSEIKIGNNYLEDVPLQVSETISDQDRKLCSFVIGRGDGKNKY